MPQTTLCLFTIPKCLKSFGDYHGNKRSKTKPNQTMETPPLHDPITLERFSSPVLASDGNTYNATSLKLAMEADPWHRSPMTKEVLRPEVFPNKVMADYLGRGVRTPAAHALFKQLPITETPIDGGIFLRVLPVSLSADDAILRRQCGLPAGVVTLVARTRRKEGAGKTLFTCMHPPPSSGSEPYFTALSRLFDVDLCAVNPTHLTTAALVFEDGTSRTAEDHWITAVAVAP